MKEGPSEVFYRGLPSLAYHTERLDTVLFGGLERRPSVKSLQRSSIDRKHFRGCQRMEDLLEVFYTFKTPQWDSMDKRPFIGIP